MRNDNIKKQPYLIDSQYYIFEPLYNIDRLIYISDPKTSNFQQMRFKKI